MATRCTLCLMYLAIERMSLTFHPHDSVHYTAHPCLVAFFLRILSGCCHERTARSLLSVHYHGFPTLPFSLSATMIPHSLTTVFWFPSYLTSAKASTTHPPRRGCPTRSPLCKPCWAPSSPPPPTHSRPASLFWWARVWCRWSDPPLPLAQVTSTG